MHGLSRSAKNRLRSLASFIWPERSIISGERHAGQGVISANDFTQLYFLNGTGCRLCAAPLEIDLGAESLCGACAGQPPRWDQARAAVAYDDISRRAVLELKRAGRRDGLATLSAWLALAGEDILEKADALVPVPLHYRRLVARGFNQSAWLAQGVARRVGKPILVDALVRHKSTRSQAGLNARQRRRNVAGAFTVRPSRISRIRGAHILLVDDVYTTGSTLDACTLALKRAGAASISILVLARVVRDTGITI